MGGAPDPPKPYNTQAELVAAQAQVKQYQAGFDAEVKKAADKYENPVDRYGKPVVGFTPYGGPSPNTGSRIRSAAGHQQLPQNRAAYESTLFGPQHIRNAPKPVQDYRRAQATVTSIQGNLDPAEQVYVQAEAAAQAVQSRNAEAQRVRGPKQKYALASSLGTVQPNQTAKARLHERKSVLGSE